MIDKIFVDSNIWLYIFLKDDKKKFEITEKYFEQNNSNSTFIISYQIINEVSNVMLKRKFTETEIRGAINFMYNIRTIHNFSKEIIMLASTLREKYTFSFWDSLIAANALNAGCNILATEDMHNGLKIENMTIKNIF